MCRGTCSANDLEDTLRLRAKEFDERVDLWRMLPLRCNRAEQYGRGNRVRSGGRLVKDELSSGPRRMSNVARRNDYDTRNLEVAYEILRDAGRYGGRDAFPAIWSRMVIARLDQRSAA